MSTGNDSKRHMNGSPPSTDDSSESSAPSSSGRPKLDPLLELEELLDSENFDSDHERISVVIAEPAPRAPRSDRASLMRDLGRKHPRLALVLTVVVAGAVWVKVLVDFIGAVK